MSRENHFLCLAVRHVTNNLKIKIFGETHININRFILIIKNSNLIKNEKTRKISIPEKIALQLLTAQCKLRSIAN